MRRIFWSALDAVLHFLTPQQRGVEWVCDRHDKASHR